jgi:hypothetical protein
LTEMNKQGYAVQAHAPGLFVLGKVVAVHRVSIDMSRTVLELGAGFVTPS